MRLLVRLLAVLGALALLVALPASFAARNDSAAPGPLALLLAGSLAVLAATALEVFLERRPGALLVASALPEGATAAPFPVPAWWAPVGLAGLADLAGGMLVSLPVAVLGAVLLLVAAYELARQVRTRRGAGAAAQDDAAAADRPADREPERGPAGPDRTTVRAARRLQEFGARHGRDGDTGLDGTVDHIARGQARVVVVGRDGSLGDVVLATPEQAGLAARLAGVDLHATFPPDLVGRIRTGRYEWTRMAGIQLGGPANS